MKYISILGLTILTSLSINAQCPEAKEGEPKSSDVTTAYTNCSLSSLDNDPIEAAVYIERAIKHEKSKLKAKTWVYRGDIYVVMARMEENPCPEAYSKAVDSYNKAKELDTKGTKEDAILQGLNYIAVDAYNKGLEGFNSSDYELAASNFEMSGKTYIDAGLTQDSTYMYAFYNAGLAYENLKNTDKAVEMYNKCLEVGYEKKNTLYRTIGTLQANDRMGEALDYIKKGKEMFPNEPEFLIQETNYYLKTKEFEKAENNLNKAIANDPSNAMLHYVLGTAMDQLNKSEGAVDAYKKAIELDENYTDAYHNLGASYVNKSVSINDEIGDLDFRADRAKIAELEKEADSALENAIPYLEKALALEPGNVQVMNSLKSIYFTFEKMDKYNDMKAKIEALN